MKEIDIYFLNLIIIKLEFINFSWKILHCAVNFEVIRIYPIQERRLKESISWGTAYVCTYFTYLRSVVVATTSWIYVSSERIHVDLHSCSVLLLLSLLYLHVYVL